MVLNHLTLRLLTHALNFFVILKGVDVSKPTEKLRYVVSEENGRRNGVTKINKKIDKSQFNKWCIKTIKHNTFIS